MCGNASDEIQKSYDVTYNKNMLEQMVTVLTTFQNNSQTSEQPQHLVEQLLLQKEWPGGHRFMRLTLRRHCLKNVSKTSRNDCM